VTAPGPAPRVQTAAYVVSRVQGALAQASSQNVIEYGRETSTGPVFLGEEVSTHNAAFWVYRGQSRSVAYGPGGKIIAAIGRVPAGRALDDARAVEDPRLAVEGPVGGAVADDDMPVAHGERGDLGVDAGLQEPHLVVVRGDAEDDVADDEQGAETDHERQHRGGQEAAAERHRSR